MPTADRRRRRAAELAGGVLPSWAPYGVFAGSAVLAAAVLLAPATFTSPCCWSSRCSSRCVAIYAWSRAVEGPRRAKDRPVTLAIAAAFGLAMIPLISLLYEVAKRGIPGLSLEFFTDRRARRRSAAAAPRTRSSAPW